MRTILKIFLLAFLLIYVSFEAAGQTQKKRFTSDVHLGLNFAQMDIEGANMYKELKLGMQVGANFNYKIFSNIQVQTGIFVTKRGLKQHIDRLDTSNTAAEVVVRGDSVFNTAADYIQVPLCIGYEVYLNSHLAVNINAGLYVAYGFKGKHRQQGYAETIINGKVDGTAITLPYSETNTFDFKRWNRFDYGGIAKVGLIYDIYTINCGYEYGLHNVSDEGRNLKNRNVFVSLGFRF
ncbi:outer membrane beta-barrel protein [Dysgonomonas sp. Marseille-P4677]|uniref:porin family protein n=1 Tax=Dysgonomonas sp. Marseille-P4677 TaxID=2364790 RepID=UPI0019116008|nr:porin family protein [Dysgonomonas sp. Marseille-P4677]MBK5721190.1 outer membrane beta-barrel protein [Dysgonomonas sp. Marseille-P4677]